jgi:hypothetical protein
MNPQEQAHNDLLDNREAAKVSASISDAITIRQATFGHILQMLVLGCVGIVGFFLQKEVSMNRETHDTVIQHGAALNDMSNHLDRIEEKMKRNSLIDRSIDSTNVTLISGLVSHK